MDLTPIIAKLHPLERQVLPFLKENTALQKIVKASSMKEVEVMRAIQWLEAKEALKILTEKHQEINLASNGFRYKQEGLPEKKFLQTLDDELKGLNIITKKSKLSRDEVNACIGLLKRKNAINVEKGEEFLQVSITDIGKELVKEKTAQEKFLTKDFPLLVADLSKEEKAVFDEFKKRKEIVVLEEKKDISIELTEVGKELVATDVSSEVVNRLSSSMLKKKEWKDKIFRAYDVTAHVPRKFQGKKHFVNEAVDYIKRIWLEMGFTEMEGNYIHSAFWDLDTLFVPQDHPAREMQDTYYIKGKAKLPQDLLPKVKAVHEDGADTGSTGWGYKYSEDEASKIMLRTHTTVLSAETISKLSKEDLPAKFFAVNKVFRNETLDWKHLFEFYQVEGIVVDPNANLKHLKGYLTQFYKKMGYSKVRMRPAFFPYTSPSLEVDVFHPVKKEWVELGGAGIFRPEITKTLLGFECPVLAWGQGMGRIISEYWKITDIRELYKNDIKQLREMKMWLK